MLATEVLVPHVKCVVCNSRGVEVKILSGAIIGGVILGWILGVGVGLSPHMLLYMLKREELKNITPELFCLKSKQIKIVYKYLQLSPE